MAALDPAEDRLGRVEAADAYVLLGSAEAGTDGIGVGSPEK